MSEHFRTVSISYNPDGRADVSELDDAIIDAALKILGCDCKEGDPEDKECAAGLWTAGARPSRLYCNGDAE